MGYNDAQHMGPILHGQHQKEFVRRIVFGFFSFFLPTRRNGFSSMFCGSISEPLTWSCQSTAVLGHSACGPGRCASLEASSAVSGRSEYLQGWIGERNCPGISGSCDGVAGGLPASQREDCFLLDDPRGTEHTGCPVRRIGSASIRSALHRREFPLPVRYSLPSIYRA